MNKIFKVVWSKTKECYVVVSEVAKNNGGKKKVLASVLAGLAMSGLFANSTQAAYEQWGGHASSTVESIALGPDTWAQNDAAVAIGMHNNANGTAPGKYSVALGSWANANGASSVALGAAVNAKGYLSVAVGYQASANEEAAVALGNQVVADKNSTAVGPGTKANGTYSFAGGYQSETTGQSGVAIGDNAKSKAARAIAIGGHAEATAEKAIAIGGDIGDTTSKNTKTTASGKNAVAIGNASQATTNDSLAVGSEATASGLNASAVGKNSKASGQSAAAFGDSAQATNTNATAVGNKANASNTNTTAIGNETTASGGNSTAIGHKSRAIDVAALAVGTNNEAGYEGTAVGLSNTVTGRTSAAFGRSNTVTGKESFAAGVRSTASGEHNVAIGYQAVTNNKATVAIGEGSKADIADGVAIGSNSATTAAAGAQGFNPADSRTNTYGGLTGTAQTSTLGAVAVGNGSAQTRQITGLAAGKEDTDAVNVAQLRSVNLKYAADTGNSDFLLTDGTLTVKGDNDLISTSVVATGADKGAVQITAKVGGTINNTDGKAVKPTTNGIATTDNVADAINNSYWKATAGGNTDGTPSVGNVKPGTQVTYSAGDNLKVKQTIAANGNQEYKYSLNPVLTGITSIANTTTGPKMTFGGNSINITGGSLDMGNNKITNLATGTDDKDAVNVKQLKDTEIHITPGTYTPDSNKKVTLTYENGDNKTVAGKTAVIDLSGLATGGTASTESVVKKAAATGDTNIADVSVAGGKAVNDPGAQYEVSVSKNAVKDAAREAVTVNNGGNTDNPISVTPTQDNTNHNTTYAVTFDGNKAAKQIPLTYKATNGTITSADQTVKLDKGLNFTGGDYTTASVGADGKVTFDVNLGTAPTVTDGKPGVPGQAGAAGKDGIATVKTVVDTINNSGWKANAKANGGTLDGNSTATVVKPGDQVNFAAGKNLTVKQDLTGEHTYTYSLNTDLKGLTSVEIGGSTIKTDGDHITITSPDTTTGATPGATVTNKVANLGDEKHIKPDTYAVANDGSVTLKYVDGNGKDLTETTKITGITNQNLSNISTAGETKIKNLAKSAINMEDGKNTKASKRDVNGVDTYKVDVEGDLTGISSITNGGTNNGKISFGPNKTVTVDGDHSITLNASTGKIGGLQNKTFDPTNFTSGQAATEDQLKSVHDTLKANERHIAPTTVATGSTENKGGTANAAGTANVYKYDAASKTVTLTYNDGNGNAVTDTKAVIDLSNLSTGGTGASSWNVKSSANTTDGGAVGATHNANAQNIADGKSVEFQSGKNLVVNQTNDITNGNATVEFSLSDKITVGKDGANGKDGSVGAKGADGSAVVMNGADGSIGLNGTNGANGISIKGKDGANGVGIDGKDGVTRIVYTEKVPDPAHPGTTKEVTHEVATMDDGLKFTGNNTATENKHKLGSLVKVQGEGVPAADEAAFQSASGNIAVTADGTDTLTIRLNKNLKGLNSIQLGGNTIQSNGDNITFTTNGGTTKTVATTDQLWTIQANGTDVPATNGKVNVVGKDGITVAKNAAGNLEISGAGLGTMNGFDVTANNGATSKTIDNGKKVDFNAGSNLTVKQTNDATGTHIEYALKEAVDLGTNGSLKAGDTTVNKDGVTIANGPSITKTGVDAGDKKITNVADGAVNATSKDAVNGSQLKKYTDAAKTTVEAGDDNVKVETDNSAADGHTNYKVSLKPVVEIGDTHKVKIDGHTGDITGLTNVDLTDPTFATKGRAATEEQLNKVLTEAKKKAVEKVQAGTAAAGDTNIATVAPKAGDTFGTAGATYEVSVSKNAVKDAAKEAVKVTSASPAITVTADNTTPHETTYKVGFDGNQAATQIPLTYKQNGGNTRTVKLSDGLNFIDGTNTKARTAADGKVTFDVMGDLTGITSISNAAGGPKMTFGGNSINVTNGDLNMGGNKITNLGKGTATTDAATVGQLTKVTSNNHSVVIHKTTDADGAPVYDLAVTGTPGAPAADPRVDMLGEEIGRVGAQGAALSALKPIQYDPLEPTQIMAGYGNYRGNSAVALGVAHYKNESTLIHGGVSWAGGSSHMMANAGVTWKVGNRDSEAAVADRYRKGPISSAYAMQQEMAAMKAQNAGLKGEVSDLKAENEQMKAQIAAMMAKLGL